MSGFVCAIFIALLQDFINTIIFQYNFCVKRARIDFEFSQEWRVATILFVLMISSVIFMCKKNMQKKKWLSRAL